MIRSIVVPLDGSELGERSLRTAAAIARRTGATLRLVRVHVPTATLLPAVPAPADSGPDDRRRATAAMYLDRLAERAARDYGTPVTSVVLEGPIVETIDRYAQHTGADLIVVSTHGQGGIGRAWLGGVAEALVRQAHRPILLIRPSWRASRRLRDAAFRRVLVPLDGSPRAERVLPCAVSLARPTRAELLLFRVVPPLEPYERAAAAYAAGIDHTGTEQRLDEAEYHLERLAETLRRRGMAVATRAFVHGQPAVAILEAAQTEAVDLIAMVTHGRCGVVRLVVGSVADRALRGGSAPLLLVRPAPI